MSSSDQASGRDPSDPHVDALATAGFVAAEGELAELRRVATDDASLGALVARRLTGEPLAWLVGSTEFAGRRIRVDRGVYVPRPHSELVAHAALDRLPAQGTAIDVCTGSGAVAAFLGWRRPGATVLATDVDPAAVACAIANGVDARCGDLFEPLPAELRGVVDVVVGVVPYVPTGSLRLLQRDTFAFERPTAYDGGDDGTTVLARVADRARHVLRPGGALVLELGGGQGRPLAALLAELGYRRIAVLHDADGDERAITATRGPRRAHAA